MHILTCTIRRHRGVHGITTRPSGASFLRYFLWQGLSCSTRHAPPVYPFGFVPMWQHSINNHLRILVSSELERLTLHILSCACQVRPSWCGQPGTHSPLRGSRSVTRSIHDLFGLCLDPEQLVNSASCSHTLDSLREVKSIDVLCCQS